MQLYLLRASELRMTILPQRVSGQYSVDFTTDGGNIAQLVRINARDDKWYLMENRSVQISGAGAVTSGEYREFELTANTLYYLRKDNRENTILMVEPETYDRKRYQIYKVPTGGMIAVGQAGYNQIQFLNQYINDSRHLHISYRDGVPSAVQICEEELRTERNNPDGLVQMNLEPESMEVFLQKEPEDEEFSEKLDAFSSDITAYWSGLPI